MDPRPLAMLALAFALVPAASPAHADPLDDVREFLQNACEVDLCVPPQPFTDRLLCPFLDETPVYDCS